MAPSSQGRQSHAVALKRRFDVTLDSRRASDDLARRGAPSAEGTRKGDDVIYQAEVHRKGKWWLVEVPAIDGLTQARRLSEAQLMARELVAVTLGVPLSEVDVEVSLRAIGRLTDLPERVKQIASDRAQARALDARAALGSEELAKELVEAGVPLRDIGTVLGVSHQRVHQLVGG